MADDPAEDTFKAAPDMEAMEADLEAAAAQPEGEGISISILIIKGVPFQNLRESAVKFGDHTR